MTIEASSMYRYNDFDYSEKIYQALWFSIASAAETASVSRVFRA